MAPWSHAALAFLIALPAVGLAARLGRRIGLVDRPDARRIHRRPVPRTGGLGLLAATALAVALLPPAGPGLLPTAAALGAFAAVGLLDDLGRLGRPGKVALQVAAAGLAVGVGFRLPATEALGASAPVATGLAILVVVNVVNFLDGIDLITCATAAVVLAAGAGAGAGEPGLLAAALGATLGLAAWNVTPAAVFPGDLATHALGFLAATTFLELPAASVRSLPGPVALAALLPALADVAWGMVVKRRRGLAFTAPHRWHVYQRLVASGCPAVLVALAYGGVAALLVVLASRLCPG